MYPGDFRQPHVPKVAPYLIRGILTHHFRVGSNWSRRRPHQGTDETNEGSYAHCLIKRGKTWKRWNRPRHVTRRHLTSRPGKSSRERRYADKSLVRGKFLIYDVSRAGKRVIDFRLYGLSCRLNRPRINFSWPRLRTAG